MSENELPEFDAKVFARLDDLADRYLAAGFDIASRRMEVHVHAMLADIARMLKAHDLEELAERIVHAPLPAPVVNPAGLRGNAQPTVAEPKKPGRPRKHPRPEALPPNGSPEPSPS